MRFLLALCVIAGAAAIYQTYRSSRPPALTPAAIKSVNGYGPGFVLQVYKELDRWYYDRNAVNAPRLLNIALAEMEKWAVLEGKKLKMGRIPENATLGEAQGRFILEFAKTRAAIANQDALAFYAASAMLRSLDDSHTGIFSRRFPTPGGIGQFSPADNLLRGALSWRGFVRLRDTDLKIYYWSVDEDGLDAEKAALRVSDRIKMMSGPDSFGMILDLRDCPGGDLRAATEILSCLLPEHTLLFRARFTHGQTEYFSRSDFVTDKPVAVIINRNSSSGAEIIASVLQQNWRAVIVGERSAGMVNIGNIFLVPGYKDVILNVSAEEYLTSDGRRLEKNGVQPDFPIDYTVFPWGDSQILAACELLLGGWQRNN